MVPALGLRAPARGVDTHGATERRNLKGRFIPDYNARFTVPAPEPGSAFTPYVSE